MQEKDPNKDSIEGRSKHLIELLKIRKRYSLGVTVQRTKPQLKIFLESFRIQAREMD